MFYKKHRLLLNEQQTNPTVYRNILSRATDKEEKKQIEKVCVHERNKLVIYRGWL